jgi:hypothetical protein
MEIISGPPSQDAINPGKRFLPGVSFFDVLDVQIPCERKLFQRSSMAGAYIGAGLGEILPGFVLHGTIDDGQLTAISKTARLGSGQINALLK